MKPAFSVIVPAYNSAATLGRALDSILSQQYKAVEVLVVDDGSTDSTAEIACGYGNPVRVIHQENGGVSSARNAGARAASCDWLAFLDADDWYYPHRLQRHAELLATHPSLELLTGNYDYVDEHGHVTGQSMPQHPAGLAALTKAAGAQFVVLDQPTEIQSFVADHFGDSHTLSVTRRRFLASGGYPLGFKVCEDVHLLTRLLAACGRIGVACEPIAAYLIHAASATRRDPLEAQRENVRTLRHLRGGMRSYPSPVRAGIKSRLASARYNLACALLRQGRRGDAFQAMAPVLVEAPGWLGLCYLASVAKG